MVGKFRWAAGLMVFAVASSAYGQSSWCGVYACNKFLASSPFAAEAAAQQSQSWVRLLYSSQADVVFGPFALGEEFYFQSLSNTYQFLEVQKRIDIPGKQGGWYEHQSQFVHEGSILHARDAFSMLDQGWIGDGPGPDRWQMLFYPETWVQVPEPSSAFMALLGLGVVACRRRGGR